jgi:hypothetical protein
MRDRTRTLRIGIAAALLAAGAARAEEGVTFEGIAGLDVGGAGSRYAFATAGASLPLGGRFRVPIRLTASDLRYSFGAAGATTDVRSPGATALAGIGLRRGAGALSLSAGGELRREERRVPGSPPATGLRAGAVAQLEGELGLGPRLQATLLASWAGAARYAWSRAALRFQLNDLAWQGPLVAFAGLEGIGQGNAETRAVRGGGVLELNLVPARLSLALHAGVETRGSPGAPWSRAPYGTLGLYRPF